MRSKYVSVSVVLTSILASSTSWGFDATSVPVVVASTTSETPTVTTATLSKPVTVQPVATAADAKTPEEHSAEIAKQRETVSEQLRVAQLELDEAKEKPTVPAKQAEKLADDVDQLKQLELVHAQRENAVARKQELLAQQQAVRDKIESLESKGLGEETTFTLPMLDVARDELLVEQQRTATVQKQLQNAAAAVEAAILARDEKERRRRAAQEAINNKPKPEDRPRLEAELARADLVNRIATATVELKQLEAANENLSAELQGLNVNFLAAKVAWLEQHVEYRPEDLQRQMLELDRQETHLKNSVVQSQNDLDYLETRYRAACQRAEEPGGDNSAVKAEIEARRFARTVEQDRIMLVNRQLARFSHIRKAWQRRYDNANETTSFASLKEWKKETDLYLVGMDLEQSELSARLEELRGKLDEINTRITTLAAVPDANTFEVRSLKDSATYLQRLIGLYEQDLGNLRSVRRLSDKLLAEIGASSNSVNASERLRYVWDRVAGLWNYEIFKTSDDRPVFVRTFALAVIAFVIGLFLARVISRFLGSRLLPRFGVDANASSALQSLAYYVMLIGFSLGALRFANVPLTAFTILGGALAVGVGFGSQNIVNNFVSGLILLAECPIRVGDLIEVDGLFATVERVGARSTRLRTGANMEIIVPNSRLLETNVVNWTLSDSRIRCDVQVGVAYGSDLQRVKELLLKAAKTQPQVMFEPSPFVWFTDFADSSLNFRLCFWIHMNSLSQRLDIETAVRFSIDRLFRESGVQIPFPQRDLNIGGSRPLTVRVVSDDEAVKRAA
ncbi:MAG: mechanosensitive ion channel [Planctomycetales bacterium]|nr:mechanosensitive ion channel [Planctomycetales bacterium]